MLLSEEVEVKWNAKNKKHYVDLGYTYTKIGDSFIAKVKDLTKGNNSDIKVKCDYCGNIYTLKYYTYYNRHNKTKDCCGNPSCTGKKASDSLFEKYNVTNCRHISGVNDKIKETNLSKYGVENPFASEEIIQKIKEVNLQKYGYEHSSQSPIIKEKISESNKNFYKEHPEKRKIKEKSPLWIGDSDYKRAERATFEYNSWRKEVYERDNYTCQKCKMKRISSSQPSLNAHHIYNFSSNEKLRTELSNGITLCEKCHNEFHSIYGKKNNNLEQLNEFLDK